MSTRRALQIGFISTVALAAGCSHSSGGMFSSLFGGSHSEPTMTTYPPQDAAQASSQQAADSPPSPEALAAKVTDYTSGVTPQLEAQNRANAATRPSTALDHLTPLEADPSIHLTQYQQDDSLAPVARPTVAAPAPVVSAGGEPGFPLTVPEGVERPNAAGQAGQGAPVWPGDQAGQAMQASAMQSPNGQWLAAQNAAGQPAVWSAEQAERQLARHVHDYPKDLEGQLDYELLLFVEGQPVPAENAMSGLSAEDHELISALMDGMVNFRSVARAKDNPLLSAKVKPLLDMADRLRTQAELALTPIVQCTEVKGFGLYTPMPTSRFIAGANDSAVVIYTEVQNFQSQLTTDNQWQTRLTAQTVLYTDTGLAVWPAKPAAEPVIDLCRQHKHDMYIAIKVPLPRNLSIGRYVLKLTVTDQEANHIAEATTPLEVVAE